MSNAGRYVNAQMLRLIDAVKGMYVDADRSMRLAPAMTPVPRLGPRAGRSRRARLRGAGITRPPMNKERRRARNKAQRRARRIQRRRSV